MDLLLVAVWLYLLIALVAANLPWLNERVLFVLTPRGNGKPAGIRFLEWGILYALVVAIGLGLERLVTGTIHAQGWQFYAITLSMFAVFAMPGFIYRHDLRRHLIHRGA